MVPPTMTSRDYTKEIGVNAGSATIPLPYAVALLAAVVAASIVGFRLVHSQSDDKETAPTVVASHVGTVKK